MNLQLSLFSELLVNVQSHVLSGIMVITSYQVMDLPAQASCTSRPQHLERPHGIGNKTKPEPVSSMVSSCPTTIVVVFLKYVNL